MESGHTKSIKNDKRSVKTISDIPDKNTTEIETRQNNTFDWKCILEGFGEWREEGEVSKTIAPKQPLSTFLRKVYLLVILKAQLSCTLC